ncbi:MAG: hypothetical protein LBB54_07160 [Cellulomonadaceae bacterium]|nr:hypothetical protein [Cellulomonadaceae bacterium]
MIATADPLPGYEIWQPGGDLDELTVRYPTSVRLAQLERGFWWLDIDMPDGRHVSVDFGIRVPQAHAYEPAEVGT